MAKNFKDATKGITSAIDSMLPQEYEARNTQGKKGMKSNRMNMAFSAENYEFMRRMAGLHQMTITKYVNHLIEEERLRKADIIQKAEELTKDL